MTTLSPHQRLEAYKWALDEIKKGDCFWPFICSQLRDWYWDNVRNMNLSNEMVQSLFIEFGNRKPSFVQGGGRWFPDNEPGNAQREALLKECIVEVEKLIESEITQLK